MAESSGELQGPDLTQGIPQSRLDRQKGVPYLGHAEGEQVLLVQVGDDVHALSATCTHWGGPLAEGAVVDDTIRCPWHHACFDLATGEARGAPALNPVDRWEVDVRDGTVFVTGKVPAGDPLDARGRSGEAPEPVVIVGAGAAGSAAAEMLRREGYGGRIVLVDPDGPAPYDRPNLSKDFLAGNAPEEWIPLRSADFWKEHDIERRVDRALALNTDARGLTLEGGDTLEYGALLLATGSTPLRLKVRGAEADYVHTLRSLADCRRIIDDADGAERAVVVGASFIGMEVAAALRQRGLEVTVVAPEDVPFEKVLGVDVGRWVRRLHEDHGVVFRLGRTVKRVNKRSITLDDGDNLETDLVVVGIGVRPDTALAEQAGLDVDDGVLVDPRLATSAPGVWAAGDIARFPDPRTGEHIRVEHWQVAQRQGQCAARNILGQGAPFTDAPFFWTQHWDVPINYVGHAVDWQGVGFDGTPGKGPFVAELLKGGERRAVVSYFRDDASLEAEAAMEREGRA